MLYNQVHHFPFLQLYYQNNHMSMAFLLGPFVVRYPLVSLCKRIWNVRLIVTFTIVANIVYAIFALALITVAFVSAFLTHIHLL